MKEVMKTITDWPRIWDNDGSASGYGTIKFIAHLLSFFYLSIVNLRNWLYDHNLLKATRLGCPVISVGNITVGGTGKTPCVVMLARMLQHRGFKPAVISRGYGGRGKGAVNIVSDGQRILLDSEIAGDEPLLMAHALTGIPVITGPRRTATGKTAIDHFGADVLICDDAMQHRQIFRDVNLVLIDGQDLKDNIHVLPRGRLREPVKALRRASAVVFTRVDGQIAVHQTIENLITKENLPVFQSLHRINDMISADKKICKPFTELEGKRVHAFCGIANPESFKKTLLSAKAVLVAFNIFPDHHYFQEHELEKIKNDFKNSAADYLITTEKDAMRLKNHPEMSKMLFVLRITMEIKDNPQSFENFILHKIRAGTKKG